jgi:hypothetical protein
MAKAVDFINEVEGSLEIAIAALKRISEHELRYDSRRKGMVDVSEIYDLQRIADVALEKMGVER